MATQSKSAGIERSPPAIQRFLAISYLYVCFVGVPAILVTRYLYWQARPDYFIDHSPSISKSASLAAAYDAFALGMGSVSISIFVVWYLTQRMYAERIAAESWTAKRRKWLNAINNSAFAVGCLAGLSLGSLSLISLEDSNAIHMYLSFIFFPAQITSFLLETYIVSALAGVGATSPRETSLVKVRYWWCAVLCIDALFFLFMFFAKDIGAWADSLTARQVFVGSEHIAAFMCLAYPTLVYVGYLDHLKRRARYAT